MQKFTEVRIDEFVFRIAPSPCALESLNDSQDADDQIVSLLHLIKCSVKGLSNTNGGIYKLEFDDSELSFRCMKDLLMLGKDTIFKLGYVCKSLALEPSSTYFTDAKNRALPDVERLQASSI